MPKRVQNLREWRQGQRELATRGRPAINDPRWITDSEQIFKILHIQRRRCWVRWRPVTTRFGFMARVGIVTRPLDSYSSVEAVIPCEDQQNERDGLSTSAVDESRRNSQEDGDPQNDPDSGPGFSHDGVGVPDSGPAAAVH